MKNRRNIQSPNKFKRRAFFKATAVASSSIVLSVCGFNDALQEYLQKDFRSLSKKKIDRIIGRLEDKYTRQYGRKITVSVKEPLPETFFGYAIDLARCIGCRRCVYACVEENNQSRKPQVHWIQVLEMEKEKGIDFRHADLYYERKKVPHEGHFYLPIQCQQCKNPPCVKSCPVKATWTEADGIVVVDYDWCIGCRSCMTACPYGARHFNWGKVN